MCWAGGFTQGGPLVRLTPWFSSGAVWALWETYEDTLHCHSWGGGTATGA